jgi:hypothetical protein
MKLNKRIKNRKMNIDPPRSRLQLYPHEVYFTTNNLTFNNIYAWLGFKTSPSTEVSLLNSLIMPSIPLLDTYTIYWAELLEDNYDYSIPVHTIVCELTCNPQGKIISLFTNEQLRGMGIGTYMLQHVKTKYESLSVSLPPMYQSLSNWFSRQGVKLC